MNFMIILSFIFLLIPFILLFLVTFIFKKSNFNSQMIFAFECGFNPQYSSRSPFSLQFFLLGILFLIFDIEITLMIPIVMNFPLPSNSFKITTILLFLSALLLGILMEWFLKTLDWIK